MVEVVPADPPMSVVVGEQERDFQVDLVSLFLDDHDDTNGDNVLYDVEISGTEPGTDDNANNLQRYNYETREFENVSTKVFTWVTKWIQPNSSDKNDYFLYTRGDQANGPWKYIVNYSNAFLDENNDKDLDTGEYWAIREGSKSYGDFVINVENNALPGYYRMKFLASYTNQTKQSINTSGVGNDTDDYGAQMNPVNASLETTNDALGPIEYYFWAPWDKNINNHHILLQ